MANKILKGEPISLATPCFNFIWQDSTNEYALRGLLHANSPAKIMNITGPEIVSIKKTAIKLGKYLGKKPIFCDKVGHNAYLNDASQAIETFDYPAVGVETLIPWQAEYIMDGGRTLDKFTHFEERKGSY